MAAEVVVAAPLVTGSETVGLLFGTAFGACGLLLLYVTSQYVRQLYLVATATPKPVASVGRTGGTALVEATVRAGDDTLQAPVGRQPCVAYLTRVRYYDPTNTPRWRTVGFDQTGEPFGLADDTGRLDVDPTDTHLVVDEKVDRVDPEGECSDRLRSIIEREDGDARYSVKWSALVGTDLKTHERTVEPGDRVAVVVRETDDRVKRALRVAESRFDDVPLDAAKAVGFGLFGLFLCYAFYVVALPLWLELL